LPPGWNKWDVFDRGINYYEYDLINKKSVIKHFGSTDADYSTSVLVQRALKCLNKVPAGQPFYLDLSFNAPHSPWTPASNYASTPVTTPPQKPNFNEADVSDKPAWLQNTPQLTPDQVATWDARRADE